MRSLAEMYGVARCVQDLHVQGLCWAPSYCTVPFLPTLYHRAAQFIRRRVPHVEISYGEQPAENILPGTADKAENDLQIPQKSH